MDEQRDVVEARLAQALVREAPEAIIVADPQGQIQLWNAGAAAMFGYSVEDALGQSLDLIIPEKQRARHWVGWQGVIETGVTRYGEGQLLAVPAMHRSGQRLSVEFSVALLRDQTGLLIGISAVMREVSKRRVADKELWVRLTELERLMADEGRVD